MQRLGEEELRALRELARRVRSLTRDELHAFTFIWEFISVGELLFEKEVARRYGIPKPYLVARSLRDKGLVERGEGCYNLPRWLRPLRRRFRHFSDVEKLLARIPP